MRARAAWIEGAVLALLVLAIVAFGGEVVRASYHGYLHATIGEAVLRDGLAPENPWHAGAPLRYYTLYPALGALLGRAGFGPLWGFALLNALAALLLGPALDALGRSLGLSFGARRAAFVAAVIGFNGLGWIGLVLSPGELLGLPPVYALAPMTLARESFGWDARLQAFLPKYLNVSSFAIALPFALWALACRDRPKRTIAPLALALALNPLVGGVAGACLAAWIAPEIVKGGWRSRGAWILAGACSVALATPFLLPALQRGPEGASLTGNPALGGSPIANLLGPLILLLVPGILGLRAMSASVRWRWIAAASICAVLVLAGEMPQGNEYKMARLGALFWAIPCGVWAADVARSRWIPAALALACVPTTIAASQAYLAWGRGAGELPLRVEGGRLAVRAECGPELFLAESRADPRAVVLMDPAFPRGRMEGGLVQGNALAPALRHALFADLPQIHNEGQPDLAERLDLLFDAFEGSPTAAARIRAKVPGRPLLFLSAGQPPAGATEVARSGALTLSSLP